MANYFDQFDEPAAQASAPAAQGGNFFDQFDAPVSAAPQKPGVIEDVAKAIPSGLARGVAGLVGLPGMMQDGVNFLTDSAAAQAREWRTGKPTTRHDIAAEAKAKGAPSLGAGDVLTMENATKTIESATGPLYQPQTVPGQYASTIAEFAPGAVFGGGSLLQRGAQVLAPALVSETAGQATKGTAWEPYFRVGGALLGGIGTAIAQAPRGGKAILGQNLDGISEVDFNAARAFQAQGAEQGVNLTLGEALNQVTGGRGQNISRMERVVANNGGEGAQRLNDFYAARPGQVQQAARSAFDDLGQVPANPHTLGGEASAAARSAIDAMPEGQALGQSTWRAGPRVSPEQAGQRIQGELQGVFERREGMRTALADQDYTAARNSPATVPLNEGLRDVQGTATALNRREIPIILNQGERDAAKAQWLADNNQSGRFQIVGDRATQFAQVDPRAVVQGIDEALATAKGAVRDGLNAAKRALMTPDGGVDSSVTGLHNSREAITDLISQAKQAGANHTVSQLHDVVKKLDQALEAVPLYGQANKGFRAASEPLAPFDPARGPGKAIERDQFNKQFAMPPERVPDALSSASDARAFNQVATPAAREAMEGKLVTDVLDQFGGRGLDVSASGIRTALRQQEDLFAQFPVARERLTAIAASREGLAKIESSPIGQIAKRDATTKRAIDALFPKDPLPGSAPQTLEAVKALSSRSPVLANQLVRSYVEGVFNNAAKELKTGPNVDGGAKFVANLKGNSERAANLRAAIQGLKNGDDILPGFEKMLDVLQATGWRPGKGSDTAFNIDLQKKLTGGASPAGFVAEQASKGGLGLPKAITERWNNYRMGKNTEELARILTDPKAVLVFKTLANAAPSSAKALMLTARLTVLGRQAAENGNGKR